MPHQRPQYYKNDLQLVDLDKKSLSDTLNKLRVAVLRGVDLIQAGDPPTKEWGSGGLFNGTPGVFLTFLRLELQSQSLADSDDEKSSLPNFLELAMQRIPARALNTPLNAARLSPTGSTTPALAAGLRILTAMTEQDGRSVISKDDFSIIQQTIKIALTSPRVIPYKGRTMGIDEVLYGRAGLLCGVLCLRAYVYDKATVSALLPTFEAVPKLVDVIVESGIQGANAYKDEYGDEDAFPLMWTWKEGKVGLGAVHGMTGILTVLLTCRKEDLDGGRNSRDYYPLIAETVTGLSKLCIANKGHLPTSLPVKPSSRPSPLVQICHGSPSILILLACARSDEHLGYHYWEPEWDEAIRLATQRVWNEGLLSKGGGICHGIAGNAWSMLLLHNCFEYGKNLNDKAKHNYRKRTGMTKCPRMEDDLDGDYFLSRALAFLLHARETQPYNSSREPSSNKYRMPDHPYSLFEGLGGTVCAWAEACAAIQTKLRKMELENAGAEPRTAPEDDEIFAALSLRQLGFPCLGGHGPSTLF